MDEAQTMIDEHYAQMNSNQSSYDVIPADSEESKRITEYNKVRRPGLDCINESLFLIVNYKEFSSLF